MDRLILYFTIAIVVLWSWFLISWTIDMAEITASWQQAVVNLETMRLKNDLEVMRINANALERLDSWLHNGRR